jgi:hypothetical protein
MNTNMIDLEFLGNSRHIKKDNSIANDHTKQTKKDVKFYRKRILETTKNLLRNKEPSLEIKGIFDKYVDECIKHFKHEDTLSFYKNTPGENKDISSEDKKKAMKKVTRQDINNLTQDILNKGVYNENKIEDFITITKKTKKQIIFPQKKNINLKDPKFKKTIKGKDKGKDKKKKDKKTDKK